MAIHRLGDRFAGFTGFHERQPTEVFPDGRSVVAANIGIGYQVRVYDQSGELIRTTDLFVYNQFGVGTHRFNTITGVAVLNDGAVVVVGHAQGSSLISFQLINPDGTLRGGLTSIANGGFAEGSFQGQPTVEATRDGGFFVNWNSGLDGGREVTPVLRLDDGRTFGTSQRGVDVVGGFYRADGSQISAPRAITFGELSAPGYTVKTEAGSQYAADIDVLPNGNTIVSFLGAAWSPNSGFGGSFGPSTGLRSAFRIINPAGEVVQQTYFAPDPLQHPNDYQNYGLTGNKVVVLTDGTFWAFYSEYLGFNGTFHTYGLFARRFDQNGAAISGETAMPITPAELRDASNGVGTMNVEALPDGSFAMAIGTRNAAGGVDLTVRHFSRDGAQLDVLLLEGGAGPNELRALEVAADGSLLVTWWSSAANQVRIQKVVITGADTQVRTGGAGDDEIVLGAGDDRADGEGGGDRMFGRGGADELHGGAGDDRLFGEAGNDRLLGGSGADLVEGGTGNDALYGGAGDDLMGGQDDADLLEGGQGADRLYGDAGDDTIGGQEANDFVDGGQGRDLLFGDGGNDLVVGGADDDRLFGQDGDDRMGGQDGNDVLDGGQGRDLLFGDAGNDLIVGGAQDDELRGQDGDDRMGGQDGNDFLDGDVGRDQLFGDGGADLIVGGIDDDELRGQDGDDVLIGGAGLDQMDGGAGRDRLVVTDFGEAETLILGADADVVELAVAAGAPRSASLARVADFQTGDGGDGIALRALLASVLTGATPGSNPLASGHLRLLQSGTDTLIQIDRDGGGDGFVTVLTLERVLAGDLTAANLDGFEPGRLQLGGGGDDTIFGDAGRDIVGGLDGNDRIFGGGGADSLFGDGGADLIEGGTGADALFGQDGDDRMGGQDGNDLVDGGAGRDMLFGDGGNDLIVGGVEGDELFGQDGDDRMGGQDGADFLDGGQGRDQLFGDAGNDLIVGGIDGDELFGQDGDDRMGGQDGNDVLDGGNGRDQLFGDAGNDLIVGGIEGDELFGQDGDDRMGGQDGNDFLDGGQGRDQLFGDSGNDLIVGGIDGDELFGQDGDDRMGGQDGDDVLDGGAGRDELFGDAGNDLIVGGGQNDFLLGQDGDDRMGGQDGNDVLEGGQGRDALFGDGGDDLIVGGLGDDSLTGNDGLDTAVFRGTRASYVVTANPDGSTTVSGADGVDVLFGIERLQFDDAVSAGPAPNDEAPYVTADPGALHPVAAVWVL